jgi:DNA mismatch endonuclease (patch repair protein)
MSAQPRKGTGPELALRRALHGRGLRYRVNVAVPGARRRTIDIAFTRVRLAVFLDGCFWHGCPNHGTSPASNSAWWQTKIAANQRRDVDTTRLLVLGGWQVMRVWEHEPCEEAATRVALQYEQLLGELAGDSAESRVARAVDGSAGFTVRT